MSSSTALTGVLGEIQVAGTMVARCTQWSISNKLASSSAWGDCDSGGWTNRAAGRKDATANTEGKFDTDDEQYDLFSQGDIVILTLWMNATLYWDFPRAMCENFDLAVNVDTEEVIGWSAAWGADGKVYYPGENGAAVRTQS